MIKYAGILCVKYSHCMLHRFLHDYLKNFNVLYFTVSRNHSESERNSHTFLRLKVPIMLELGWIVGLRPIVRLWDLAYRGRRGLSKGT